MFREVTIKGSFLSTYKAPGAPLDGAPLCLAGEHCTVAGDVHAQLDAAERDGVRSLLLVLVECLGGATREMERLYRRLRAFSRSGGHVTAFVSGRNVSAAPVIVAAADRVMMERGSRLVLHGALGDPAAVSRCDRWIAETLSMRTGMPRERLAVLLAEPEVYAEIHNAGAERLGWADWGACTLDGARRLAELAGARLASGDREALPMERYSTKRSRHLASLAGAAAIAVALTGCEPAVAHQTGTSDAATAPSPAWNFIDGDVALAARTWQTGSAGSTAIRRSVAENPSTGRLVALTGVTGVASTSDDGGRTWTDRAMPTADYYALVWAGTQFVATGFGTAAATSPDGVTWTARTLAAHSPSVAWGALAWDGTYVVALSTISAIAVMQRSADAGNTWSTVAVPTAIWSALEGDPDTGTLVSISRLGNIRRSVDGGTTWTTASGVAPSLGTGERHALMLGPDVEATGTRKKHWVVVGPFVDDASASYDDGATWEAVTMPAGASSHQVDSGAWGVGASGRGVFVVMAFATPTRSDDRCYLSGDGKVWQPFRVALAASYVKTIFSRGASLNRFVSVGTYDATGQGMVGFSATLP